MLKKIIVLASLLGSSHFAFAQVQSSEKVTIPKVKQAPVLKDYIGALPANAALLGLEISDFKQRNPGDGTPISKQTKAYLSYDEHYFYAVFVAKDDPALVRARIAKREDIDGDDLVTLELDTFKDQRRSFVFEVNPLGVQMDGKRTEGQEIDYQFNTQWESEAQLTDDGFVVKMAIPFKSLRFENGDEQTWGIAVGRWIARLSEEAFWPHISKQVAGFVPQMATIRIPEKMSAGRNVQLLPFVYAGKTKVLNTEDLNAPFWQRENKLQAGLDAKWVIGDAAALDVTLKPDFSEVESDEPKITVGQRYEVEFLETRPFFLENASFFKTPNPLFFSRRIIEPSAGLRLTGRKDTWSYGGLVMDDKAAMSSSTSDPHPSLPTQAAKIAMLRMQNDVSDDLQLGLLMTDKRLGKERNAVLGLDARAHLDENWVMQTQLAQSETRADERSTGQLRYVDVKHEGKHLEYEAKYLDITPQFDTNLGFLPRTDIKQIAQEAQYRWHIADHSWLQSIGPVLESSYTRNQHHQLQDWQHEVGVSGFGAGNTEFVAKIERGMERFQERNYHKPGVEIQFHSGWFDWLQIDSEWNWTKGINYQPSERANEQAMTNPNQLMGTARSVDLRLQFKPHVQWRFEEKIVWNDLRNDSGDLVFKNLTARSKLSYQHNRFFGVRWLMDYQILSANPQWTSLKSGKQLNTDLQFSYILSPGTTVYAGYGNRQENLAWTGNPNRLQRTENLNLRTGSRVFIKLNYLFQM
jgi:hypothetical protein